MQLMTAIQSAIANPSQANLSILFQAFDEEIAQQSEAAQFQVAGDVIVQLAELIELRANLFLGDWEDRHHPPSFEEPILTAEMLQDVLRQTMTLNLEELLEIFDRKEREASDSIVSTVEKDNLIQFLDQLEQEEAKQAAMAIAHDEDVTAWIRAIGQWMNHQPLILSILELQQDLRMPFAQVWLALLLGNFELEQQGDFYDPTTILVKRQ